MFDLDELTSRCTEARATDAPHSAIREVLEWAVSPSSDIASALGDPAGGIQLLHRADDLTILNVVWPPHMSIFPHDHRMWAAIGIYGGREDNAFFRRDGDHVVSSGGKTLSEGEVLVLGDDAIHGVDNPLNAYTGAIHVYGGDFVGTPRSQWETEDSPEAPYDLELVQQRFAAAEDGARKRDVPS